MESLREYLASGFLKQVEKELGREKTLRLLWPCVVGSQLAAYTKLDRIRGATLMICVPDRAWISSLGSFQKMILDAVNRFASEAPYEAVEFVARPQDFPQSQREQGTASKEQKKDLQPLGVDAAAIADEQLRELFVSSAEKYFAREERRK